jgi:hypothetical protein
MACDYAVEPADHDAPLWRRCTDQALTPTSMLRPARHRRRPRRGQPPTVRSLSVRRPALAPPRRGCILLAAATPLRLRTRHTAPCYTPLNEGGRERNSARAGISQDAPIPILASGGKDAGSAEGPAGTISSYEAQPQQPCHEGPFGQIDGWMLGSMAACKNQEFCRVVLTVGVLHLLSFHAVQPKPLISAPARPDGRRARAGRGRSIAGTFAR